MSNTKHKRGDTRKDGKVFFCYSKNCKNGEVWLRQDEFEERVSRHRAYNKAHRAKNKDRNRELAKKWRARNPDKCKASCARWRAKNKHKKKAYYENNKDNWRRYQRDYAKRESQKEGSLHILGRVMRNRVNEVMRSKGVRKRRASYDYLGCTVEELKTYLESMFEEGMTWKNRGYRGWHIDHIIPLASANTEGELLKLFHHKNLQPLWAKDNLRKGASLPRK